MQPVSHTDEEAIYREVQAFAEVWNRGNANALAEFYTEDAVRVGAFGDIQHGRAEIEAAYDRLLHGTMPGATVRMERGTIRMLGPDLAVWQGGLEVVATGAVLKGHVVQVMQKQGDRWLVVEAHPKFFPPQP